ncbi:hypothetical protein JGH11_02530 [Dysgonomonas sp. Marseille-P4677]|uniref:hypothetical protein n=1 Tax=Dysgonomonas sp. Marseille-P4677 TaxID=2364790 RepID=UPI0019138D04|nr:hypothetical protein [Dysgonomonas sp. Marseille-P4677]MBK5719743.1 hypothetical protein [Dysgonomonas sp. Marseille-P4677]
MNKKNCFLSVLFALAFFIYSCDEKKELIPTTIDGEWIVIERTLETNDPSLDMNVNDLFREDSRNYTIKRIFSENQNNPAIGAIETLAIDKKTDVSFRKRIGTYAITSDSIFIEDELLKDFRQKYLLGPTLLETQVKVTKKELDVLVFEIGGDPNTVREGTVGKLKMREVR